MRRKNIPLILVVIVAAFLFLRPTLSEKLPAWPGYRVAPYVRVKAPLVALTHVRVIDGTGAAHFRMPLLYSRTAKFSRSAVLTRRPFPQAPKFLISLATL
jgi:hypothetical protein